MRRALSSGLPESWTTLNAGGAPAGGALSHHIEGRSRGAHRTGAWRRSSHRAATAGSATARRAAGTPACRTCRPRASSPRSRALVIEPDHMAELVGDDAGVVPLIHAALVQLHRRVLGVADGREAGPGPIAGPLWISTCARRRVFAFTNLIRTPLVFQARIACCDPGAVRRRRRILIIADPGRLPRHR